MQLYRAIFFASFLFRKRNEELSLITSCGFTFKTFAMANNVLRKVVVNHVQKEMLIYGPSWLKMPVSLEKNLHTS